MLTSRKQEDRHGIGKSSGGPRTSALRFARGSAVRQIASSIFIFSQPCSLLYFVFGSSAAERLRCGMA